MNLVSLNNYQTLLQCFVLLLLSNVGKGQDFEWAQQFQSNAVSGSLNMSSEVTDIATDSYGNMFICGNFYDSIQFDGSPISKHIVNKYGAFLAKISKTGKHIWSHAFSSNQEFYWMGGCQLSLKEGHLYFSANGLDNTMDIDPSSIYEPIFRSSFLARFDTSGNYLWHLSSDSIGFVDIEFSKTNDNLFILGAGKSASIHHSLLSDTIIGNDKLGFFFGAINNKGEFKTFNKIQSKETFYDFWINDLTIDYQDNIILCGYIDSDSVDIKVDSSLLIMTSINESQFVIKYDSTGIYSWHRMLTPKDSSSWTNPLIMSAIDAENNITICGYFKGELVIDQSSNTYVSDYGEFLSSLYITQFNEIGEYNWNRTIVNYNFSGPTYTNISFSDIEIGCNNLIYISGSVRNSIFNPEFENIIIQSADIAVYYKKDFITIYNELGSIIHVETFAKTWSSGPQIDINSSSIFVGGRYLSESQFYLDDSLVFEFPEDTIFRGYVAKFNSPFHDDLSLFKDSVLCRNDNYIFNENILNKKYYWHNESIADINLNKIDSTMLLIQADYIDCFKDNDTIFIAIKNCNERLIMPNIFSPNEDGVNDYFKPIEYFGIQASELKIYNRWGNQVFESTDIETGWSGENSIQGVYYWIVQYLNEQNEVKVVHGNVTLTN